MSHKQSATLGPESLPSERVGKLIGTFKAVIAPA
jgi:hypothetical protein